MQQENDKENKENDENAQIDQIVQIVINKMDKKDQLHKKKIIFRQEGKGILNELKLKNKSWLKINRLRPIKPMKVFENYR